MLKLRAPAKINLTLEVLGKRKDGYHEIASVIQTISLADTLEFQLAETFTFSCDDPEWRADKSLVPKAALLFAGYSGIKSKACIRIQKTIPFSAGLGGESSAAAATLIALNYLFKTGLPLGELYQMGKELGSDVPFFLTGGTALLSGRGEQVSTLPGLPLYHVVLLIPPDLDIPDKTAKMYSLLRPSQFTSGKTTDNFIIFLTAGTGEALPEIYNVFEGVAVEVFDRFLWYKEQFYLAGAKTVNLAGSGPVLFSLEADENKAREIARFLTKRGLKAITAHTLESTGNDSFI